MKLEGSGRKSILATFDIATVLALPVPRITVGPLLGHLSLIDLHKKME
jgi:hypothetical protein